MQPNWYCVGFIANKERLAIQHLERQAYEVFCPRMTRTVSHARKRVKKLVPIFPGYLFVHLDLSRQRWRPINGTLGVTHIVSVAERPAPLKTGFVETLLDHADADGVVTFNEEFQPGDRVRMVGGAMHNQLGTLCRMKGPDRLVVLMSMLGREVETTVPKSMLIKAG